MRAWILTSAALVAGALGLCGCGGQTSVDAASLVSVSPGGKAAADPGAAIVVDALRGRLTDVTVVSADGRHVPGTVAADGRSWRSSGPLGAGRQYTVRVSADDGEGGRGSTVQEFATRPAPKSLTAQLTPGDKAVYGVGEPITVALSQPVHDRAARQIVERGLTVNSTPSVRGGWYWVNDRMLHFRPQGYWPTHAGVSAAFDIQGRQVAGDVYGGAPSRISFRTGDRLLAVTDAGSDYMTVYRNGQVINTLAVTTGKPGFSTRNGIKVVLEQQAQVLMDSATVGIADGSSDAYRKDVYWDTRVTWSGEYVHAAPWSVASQGVANVSHGCTGMSTGNAHWFYDTFHRGDLVQVVNSLGGRMEPFGNGFGDWNLSWADWQKGSALGKVVDTAGTGAVNPAPVGFLRPAA
ncbi:lipoprotein-anchoring transpeptidase ErfK/SrfK [Streptacidiphilus sp. MAP12-16]|uniref:L,D-transpeptidase n=1 Tax=Streptacidiphilus sp. MAP12-16 TaxID=3156300 RepID=UPI003518C512